MSYVTLGPPPIQNDLVPGQKITTQFKQYLTNVNATIQATMLPINYTSSTTSTTQTGVAIQNPTYDTAEIASMSPPDGVSVYDSQAGKMNFRINGNWETFP